MRISLRKFKLAVYLILAAVVAVIIGGSIFPITVPISEAMIKGKVEEKMPILVTKQFNVPLTQKTIDIDTEIKSAEIDIVSNVIYANTDGVVSHKDHSVRFKVEARGASIYYDREEYAFYLKPQSIDVILNAEDVSKLVKAAKNTIEGIPEEEVEGEKKSLFGKLVSKAKGKAAEVVSNDKTKELIVDKMTNAANYTATKALNTIPVYKLKDGDIDNVTKVFLSDVDIQDGKLKISFSMLNILNTILSTLGIIAVFILFLFWVSSSVRKKDKWSVGFIEVATEGIVGGLL